MLSSYAVVIDEDKPVVNQSIVQEVVEASQGSFSQELCKFDLILYAHDIITTAGIVWYLITTMPVRGQVKKRLMTHCRPSGSYVHSLTWFL